MLNGDAHLSTTWERELRIWPLQFSKTRARKAYQKAPALIILVEVLVRMLIQIDEPVIRWVEPDFRLLYVGSDRDFVASLRNALRRPVFQIVPCPDHRSAILFLESDIWYHLFLSEVDTQDPTGLELIRLVRSLSHRKRIPIIAVTANERKRDLEEVTRREGVTKCVSKQETYQPLYQRLSSAVYVWGR